MNNIFTELRKVELTLQRLTIIAEQVNEGVMVADLDGTARFINTAMAKMHGYPSSNELIGKNISVFHSEDQIKTDVFPMIEEVKRKGQFLGPIEHLRNDGTVFPAQTKMTLLKDGKDKAVGLVVFVTDITERIQVEKSLTRQILELTATNERLQREISKQRQTIEQLAQFRDGLKQQFEQQQAQLTTTEEQLQDRSTKLQLAQQQINEQAAELTTLKQRLQKQAAERENVEQQLRQHSELSEQHAAELTSANQQLEQQQAQLSKANEQLKGQVEDLTAELAMTEEQLQQQVLTMPLEKLFTEHRELEEMTSENTKESYKLKDPGRLIMDKEKFRSLAEMAKRLSK